MIFGWFIKSNDNLKRGIKNDSRQLATCRQTRSTRCDENKIINEVLPDTRNYSGCSALYMTENIDIPNQVEFVSIWDSKEHYDTYLNWRDETGLLAEMAEKYLEADPVFRFLAIEKEF